MIKYQILNLSHPDKGFRKDRNRDGGGGGGGGGVVVVVGGGGVGVMVMVKDCYQATSIPMEAVSGEVC